MHIDLNLYDIFIFGGRAKKFEVLSEPLWKTVRFFIILNEGEDFKSPKKAIKALLKFNNIDEPTIADLFNQALLAIPTFNSTLSKIKIIFSNA